MTSSTTLLALYDAQQRLIVPEHPPAGQRFELTDGVLRVTGRSEGMVETAQHLPVSGAELDALIAEHRDFFAARGEAVEWKTRAHDLPADIPQRLERAGFVAQECEAVLVGHTADLLVTRQLAAGITIRETRDHDDIVGMADMLAEVWGYDFAWFVDELEAQLAAAPELTAVFVAEAEGKIVSGARIEFTPGSDFAGLWGGSTLAKWQGKGIYGAIGAARAVLAQERGVPYLQVDASAESSPILKRRGFIELTTTTPYLWTPSAQPAT
ncbi:MAG: GNAT family N-acetyltransferase [Rhodoglobus sp.]